jgi:hypothetical protein
LGRRHCSRPRLAARRNAGGLWIVTPGGTVISPALDVLAARMSHRLGATRPDVVVVVIGVVVVAVGRPEVRGVVVEVAAPDHPVGGVPRSAIRPMRAPDKRSLP